MMETESCFFLSFVFSFFLAFPSCFAALRSHRIPMLEQRCTAAPSTLLCSPHTPAAQSATKQTIRKQENKKRKHTPKTKHQLLNLKHTKTRKKQTPQSETNQRNKQHSKKRHLHTFLFTCKTRLRVRNRRDAV